MEQTQADKEAALAQLKSQQEVLEKQQQEVEAQRREEEMVREAQTQSFHLLEQELADRAGHIAQAESVLQHERQQVLHSRGQLAVVQSHVLNLLNKGEKGGDEPSGLVTHNLDATEEPEAELDESDTGSPMGTKESDVWDMDWS